MAAVELDKADLALLLNAAETTIQRLQGVLPQLEEPDGPLHAHLLTSLAGLSELHDRLHAARMDELTPDEFDEERMLDVAMARLAQDAEQRVTQRLREEKLTGLRIDELYAYVATDGDDDEGLPAANINGAAMPLIAADQARLTSLRPYAEQVVRATGRPVRLVRFSERTVIETIEP